MKIINTVGGFNEMIASLFLNDRNEVNRSLTTDQIVNQVLNLMQSQSNLKFDLTNKIQVIQLMDEPQSQAILSKIVYFNKNILSFLVKKEKDLGKI